MSDLALGSVVVLLSALGLSLLFGTFLIFKIVFGAYLIGLFLLGLGVIFEELFWYL